MLHEIVIRQTGSKKELGVELQIPDKFADVARDESNAACAIKFRIVRATDKGRVMINSTDYKEGRVKDEDIIIVVKNQFKAKYSYDFRTRGQAMTKVEKASKSMADMSIDELENMQKEIDKLKQAKKG